eukprot:6387889-Amphidinium_carterae.1
MKRGPPDVSRRKAPKKDRGGERHASLQLLRSLNHALVMGMGVDISAWSVCDLLSGWKLDVVQHVLSDMAARSHGL